MSTVTHFIEVFPSLFQYFVCKFIEGQMGHTFLNRVLEAGFPFQEAGLKLDVTRWVPRFTQSVRAGNISERTDGHGYTAAIWDLSVRSQNAGQVLN